MKTRLILALTLAASAGIPAHAQGRDATVTLRIDRGNVMASQGGDFATAASGTRLAPGDRVMLAEGSGATLVYDDGCTRAYDEAGVYAVPATCHQAVAFDTRGLLIIAAGTGAVAAGLASMGKTDGIPPAPPPVSP